MTQIDQFESIFRSALRDVFVYEPVVIRTALLITDRRQSEAQDYLLDVRRFLAVLGTNVGWQVFGDENRFSTLDVLSKIEQTKPDLVCTYRNLHDEAWRHPHSLGEHLDVLLQKTDAPVVILPHPDADYAHAHAMEDTNNVMAMTGHLANDPRLVNYAAAFTATAGTLYLSHLEDDAVFERYMAAISKIPDIDSDVAREKIAVQLLKEPRDYAAGSARVLKENRPDLSVEMGIAFGHRLSEYKRAIGEHEIDLLVMNAKDDDQLAMHGLVYPLAIELRQIPLLML